MAGPEERAVVEALVDTEVGTLTLANIKGYYDSYRQENLDPVSYDDYIAVLESYYRNSAIAGES